MVFVNLRLPLVDLLRDYKNWNNITLSLVVLIAYVYNKQKYGPKTGVVLQIFTWLPLLDVLRNYEGELVINMEHSDSREY